MISVITICYNSGKTIERTFQSVLNQTCLPEEYILIDGASSDTTIEIVNQYKPLFEGKGVHFVTVSEKDAGLYDAMNKGLGLATQSWIHFLNSDDFYAHNQVLENIRPELDERHAIVYGRVIKFNRWKDSVMFDIKENKLKLNVLFGCPVAQPATFYNKSLFDSGYKFDLSYKISADYKLFAELIKAGVRFQFVPRFITYFSEDGLSTAELNRLALDENKRLLRECGLFTGFAQLRKYPLLFKCCLMVLKIYSHF
ncbi:MAG: glycosyltransferase [Candidatus Symbiothrix sp.]|jgi:glycosyltransferase involved in cell wall biosynthesis|nr:glycosyltransferase [Candidatus Symbiothrix sp.]